MKVNKNIKLFINYFLGPVLFLWLAWSIYNQIHNQPGLESSWVHIKESLNSSKIIYLVLVIMLMVVNWSLESWKWMIAIRQIQQISFIRAFKAVLSGISFSLSTPNRVGEYVGRVLYIDEGKRIKAVSLTIACSMSQLIVTILMGIISLIFLKDKIIGSHMLSSLWVKVFLYGSLAAFVILSLFYFRLSWLVKWIDRLPASKKFSWSIEALEHFNATILLRFLSLSVLRFFVFITQYYLFFKLFGVEVNFLQSFVTISVMFLVLAIIPTIALFTDLGLRNEVSIKLLGLFSTNHLGISLTSLGIWFINLIIPALIGSLFILGIKKIFKNKNEST